MASGVDLVIFGASGDLARRKILPSLGALVSREGTKLRVIGAGRSHTSTDEFRAVVKETSGSPELAASAEWVQLDYADPATFAPVNTLITGTKVVIFYLATPPDTFSPILGAIANSAMATKGDPSRRVVLEKPLGHDLPSAKKLNAQLATAFDEEQVYRIDHYLAKDTVQNGAVRDIFQNHVLQLLALVTMEPPTTFDPDYVRRAKRAALRAMSPLDVTSAVRGQYEGYLDEPGVAPESRRETYSAARVAIENWRWDGVPIFVRTGKALRRRATEVVIKLRDAPLLRIGGRRQRGVPTLIVIRVQPDEGITLRIGAKRPGPKFELVPAGMRLDYAKLTRAPLPDAYENVLSEVLTGGHSAFPGAEEIELQWEIVDPLIKAWEAEGHPEVYPVGSWGPRAADDLVAAGGGRWIVSGDEPGTA